MKLDKKMFFSLLCTVTINVGCNTTTTTKETAPSGAELELHERFNTQKQTFDINPKRDTILLSNRGSFISIPKDNFLDNQGDLVTENVEITFVEIQNIEEAAKFGLSTLTTNNELLETAGMYYLNASANNQALAYRKPIEVEVESEVLLPDLQLFEGNEFILWENEQPLAATMKNIPLDWVIHPRQQGVIDKIEEWGVVKPQLTQSPLYLFDCPSVSIYNILVKEEKKLKSTWMATADFKYRIELIKNSCDLECFSIYLEHINEPLWQADEAVAQYLEGNANAEAVNFRKLALLKKTRVENGGIGAGVRKQLLEMIRKEVRKGQSAAAFGYPVAFPFTRTGWINLDVFVSDYSNVAVTEELNIMATVKRENIPMGVDLQAYLLCLDWYSAIGMEEEELENKFSIGPLSALYKGTKILLVVTDAKGTYTGIEEFVIDSNNNINLNVTVTHTTPSQKALKEKYMKPPARLICTNENSTKKCCE